MSSTNDDAGDGHEPSPVPKEPVGEDFEDLVCALFAASGWYVSPNISHIEGAHNLLEIDLLATRWENGRYRRVLVEAKSGGWGWGDVLKLLGQGALLDVKEMWFLVRRDERDIESARSRFASKNCFVYNLGATTTEIINAFAEQVGDDLAYRDVAFWYHVFKVRREVLKCVRSSDYPPSLRPVLDDLKQQKLLIDDGLFQHDTVFGRLQALRDGFEGRRRLAAKVAQALDADPQMPSRSHFRDAMYGVGHPLVEVALFLETRSRLATLAAVIEYLTIEDEPSDPGQDVAILLGLPESTYSAIRELRDRDQVHLYPLIWQRFVYEFGGLIIIGREDEEYQLLAQQTGAHPTTVRQTLSLWGTLYPGVDWMASYYGVRLLKLVPASIQGMGALRRTQLYKTKKGMRSYPAMMVDSPTGAAFLKRVNNISYHRERGQTCPEDHLGPAASPPVEPVDSFDEEPF